MILDKIQSEKTIEELTMKNILFLSHGGGPLPLLGDKSHNEMVQCLKKIPRLLDKPSAIIVISAHWEEDAIGIASGESPGIIYDYYGFPEESYSISYPCPGSPGLAKKLGQLYKDSGMSVKLNDKRGFDHGLFVPLKIMYPDADIPCVQVSLKNNLDPEDHIQLGRVLQKIKEKDILIIGSGFSFHNMRAFFAQETDETRQANESFESWLAETCCSKKITESERFSRLVQWQAAPGARYCHPREEHLLPLHVCYGAAETPAQKHFKLNILNKKASMYLW